MNRRFAFLVLFFAVTFSFNGYSFGNSFYKTLCKVAEPQKNQLKMYENRLGEYALNMQMLETYKHYRSCKKMDPKLTVDVVFNDDLKTLEKELKHQQNLTAEETRELNRKSYEVFAEAQYWYGRYLNQLIRRTGDLTQKSILEQIKRRVKTVRINKAKTCNAFNANYNFVSHSVDTCYEILPFPRTTLFAIYAHELTHSIDPCSLQFSFTQIIDENPFYREQLAGNTKPSQGYTILPIEWIMEDLVLGKEQLKTVMQPLHYNLNPFKKVLECLQSESSVQAKKRQNPIEKALVVDQERMCSSTLEDGQMAESFSDWMAYEVLGYYFKIRKNLDLKEKVFESALNIIANECQEIESDVERAMRTAIMASESCKNDNEKFFNRQRNLRQQTLMDTHPNGSRRVNRLFAVHPTLQRLLLFHYSSQEAPIGNDGGTYCGEQL